MGRNSPPLAHAAQSPLPPRSCPPQLFRTSQAQAEASKRHKLATRSVPLWSLSHGDERRGRCVDIKLPPWEGRCVDIKHPPWSMVDIQHPPRRQQAGAMRRHQDGFLLGVVADPSCQCNNTQTPQYRKALAVLHLVLYWCIGGVFAMWPTTPFPGGRW